MNGTQVLNQPEVIAETRRYDRFEARARASVKFTTVYTINAATKTPVEIEDSGYLSTSAYRVVYLEIEIISSVSNGRYGIVTYNGDRRVVEFNGKAWHLMTRATLGA